MRGAMYACFSGLAMIFIQLSLFMTSTVAEFGSVWVASLANFIIIGTSSMSIICTGPCPLH